MTTRPAGKLSYLQNRGTFNFPSILPSLLLLFSFLRSILLFSNVMLMIGQETSEIVSAKGKQTEFLKRTKERKSKENMKILSIKS